jgi:hypothetical protein
VTGLHGDRAGQRRGAWLAQVGKDKLFQADQVRLKARQGGLGLSRS